LVVKRKTKTNKPSEDVARGDNAEGGGGEVAESLASLRGDTTGVLLENKRTKFLRKICF